MNLSGVKNINVFFTPNICEFYPVDSYENRIIPYMKTCDMKSFHIRDYHYSKYFEYLKTNIPLSIESSHIDEDFVTFTVNSEHGNIFHGFFDLILVINPIELSVDSDNELQNNGYSFKNYNLFGCPVFHLTYVTQHCNKNRIKTELMNHFGYNWMSSLVQYI